MTKNKKLTNQWKEGRCVPIGFLSDFYSMLVPAHRVQRLEWSPVFLFRSLLFGPSGQGMTHRLYPICTTNQVEDRNWGSVRPDRAEVEPDTGIPVARTSYIRSLSPTHPGSWWGSLTFLHCEQPLRVTATGTQYYLQKDCSYCLTKPFPMSQSWEPWEMPKRWARHSHFFQMAVSVFT